MSALQGAVHAGAHYVFAVDPVEWKRDQALKFGATHAYPDVETALAAIVWTPPTGACALSVSCQKNSGSM